MNCVPAESETVNIHCGWQEKFYDGRIALLISGELNNYLADIDVQAEEMFSRLVKQMAAHGDVTEKLKAKFCMFI